MKRLKVWFWIVLLLVGESDVRAQVPACKADLDGNGVVDFADFLIFAQHYGKTNLVPCSPDTVEKVVRDTIYIDSGSGGNTGSGGGGNQGTQTDSLDVPTGLDSIHVRYIVHDESIGISLSVYYLDNDQNFIRVFGKIWRNPDKITVTIRRRQGDGYREIYRSNNVEYERNMYLSDTQYGFGINIPRSEIPNHYADMRRLLPSDFPNVFQIWVTVEFDGVEYRPLGE